MQRKYSRTLVPAGAFSERDENAGWSRNVFIYGNLSLTVEILGAGGAENRETNE